MPLVKLRVDIESYLKGIEKEYDEDVGMMADPEVDDIQDPREKRKKADTWLACRLGQLSHDREYAKAPLYRAHQADLLNMSDFFEAEKRINALYQRVEEQSRKRYREVIGAQPTTTQ